MGRTKPKNRSASSFVWSRRWTGKDQDRVLIVTEGEKSETSYFSRLAIELELSGVTYNEKQRNCSNKCH